MQGRVLHFRGSLSIADFIRHKHDARFQFASISFEVREQIGAEIREALDSGFTQSLRVS